MSLCALNVTDLEREREIYQGHEESALTEVSRKLCDLRGIEAAVILRVSHISHPCVFIYFG